MGGVQLLTGALCKILDALAPPTCAACDAPGRPTFCPTCAALAPALPLDDPAPEVDGVPLFVAGAYAPPLSTAIARFKYQGRAELACCLSRLVAPALGSLALPPGSALVPVPLHPRRLASRGYNQAALLAQELAKQAGLRCEARLLRRARETERQVGKSRRLRLTNAEGAFELRRAWRWGSSAAPAHAVLVDDVVTTGSTVRECARALAAGGVEVLAIVALARALPAR